MAKIYVGNLPFSASNEEVRQLFGQYGKVESVDLVADLDTGRPRGFGFVEMSDGAEQAIQALNLRDRRGRVLNVNEVRPRQSPREGSRSNW